MGDAEMAGVMRRITGTVIITGTEEQLEAPTEALKVSDAAERWLETYVQTQRGDSGRRLAMQRYKDFLKPCLGDRLLSRLTGEDVRAYRVHLERSTRLSPTSVSHVLSDCRCMLHWAEDCGLIDRSPFPRRVMPRLQERPPDRLADAEVDALTAMPEHYGFIARFGLGTGMRWGELVRAQRSDLQNDEIVVHHTKNRRVRRIPLPPALLAEVHGRVGRLLPVENSWGFTYQARRLSGVTRFHPHMMRHTFACHWIEAGGSLAALQDLLGHRSITTTQRYGRLGQDMVRREAERVYSGRQ